MILIIIAIINFKSLVSQLKNVIEKLLNIYQIQTYPNFKSLVSQVKNAKDIEEYVNRVFLYRYTLSTTPWEVTHWDGFKFNLENVDRLYYFRFKNHRRGGQKFIMIARMQYRDKLPFYLRMRLFLDSVHAEFIVGRMFLSRDANIFMNLILKDEEEDEEDLNKNLIYASLKEDGIYIKEEEKEEEYNRNARPLKYLCHQSIYNKIHLLSGYRSVLPKILADSIDDFIKMREAKQWYDKFTIFKRKKNYL